MRAVGVAPSGGAAPTAAGTKSAGLLRPPAVRQPSGSVDDVGTGIVPTTGLWTGRLVAQKRTAWGDYFHLLSAIKVDGEVTAVRVARELRARSRFLRELCARSPGTTVRSGQGTDSVLFPCRRSCCRSTTSRVSPLGISLSEARAGSTLALDFISVADALMLLRCTD